MKAKKKEFINILEKDITYNEYLEKYNTSGNINETFDKEEKGYAVSSEDGNFVWFITSDYFNKYYELVHMVE